MGREVSAARLPPGDRGLPIIRAHVAGFLTGVDVWLTPTLVDPAGPHRRDHLHSDEPCRALEVGGKTVAYAGVVANITGNPAMSVPLFWNGDGPTDRRPLPRPLRRRGDPVPARRPARARAPLERTHTSGRWTLTDHVPIEEWTADLVGLPAPSVLTIVLRQLGALGVMPRGPITTFPSGSDRGALPAAPSTPGSRARPTRPARRAREPAWPDRGALRRRAPCSSPAP